MRRVELKGKAPKKWDVCAPHSQGSAQRTNEFFLSLLFRSDSRNGLRRKPRTAHSLRLWIFLLLRGHTLAADVYVISLIASPVFRETGFYNLKPHFINTYWVLVRLNTCQRSRLDVFTQNVLVLLTCSLFGSVMAEKPTWSGVDTCQGSLDFSLKMCLFD